MIVKTKESNGVEFWPAKHRDALFAIKGGENEYEWGVCRFYECRHHHRAVATGAAAPVTAVNICSCYVMFLCDDCFEKHNQGVDVEISDMGPIPVLAAIMRRGWEGWQHVEKGERDHG